MVLPCARPVSAYVLNVPMCLEITHFAASATETCVFLSRSVLSSRRRGRAGQPAPGPQATMALEEALDIAPWLSAPLAKILTTHEHSADPLLVQLALQASIATCAARSLSLFCVGFPAKLDGLLGKIYGQMAGAGMSLYIYRLQY